MLELGNEITKQAPATVRMDGPRAYKRRQFRWCFEVNAVRSGGGVQRFGSGAFEGFVTAHDVPARGVVTFVRAFLGRVPGYQNPCLVGSMFPPTRSK